MRKKISIGFISLALVLLFAGGISMYESYRLSKQAHEVIEQNNRNTLLANRMVTALQTQNSSILNMLFLGDSLPDADYSIGKTAFDNAFTEAAETSTDKTDLTTIYDLRQQYNQVINTFLNGETKMNDAFLSFYMESYYALDQALTDYLISPDNSVESRAATLEKNVYKTITPSILTLIVAIIIVLMFFFFIESYYVRPLTSIYKSLKNSLSHHIPFDPKFESNDDELNGMKEMIAELIEQKKN